MKEWLRRNGWWLTVLGLVLVVLLGIFTYVFASRQARTSHFVVTLGTNGWLVIVTAVLAAFTGLMALATYLTVRTGQSEVAQSQALITIGQQQVEEARKQTSAASAAMDASVMPLLASGEGYDTSSGGIECPDGFLIGDGGEIPTLSQTYVRDVSTTQGNAILVSVTFLNVGAGVAVVRSLSLQLASGTGWPGMMNRSIVRPGEDVRCSFTLPANREDVPDEDRQQLRAANASVDIGYTDAHGRQKFRSKAHLSGKQGSANQTIPFIRQIAVYRNGETQPFIMSGPSG